MSAAAAPVTADVLVIGAGPAGLAAAAQVARDGAGSVLVLEREQEAGGIPRHSDHLGYGVRDLHRFLTGPSYARRLVGRTEDAGVEVRTEATVTGWTPDGAAEVTSPAGRLHVAADAIVLATGARERPRAARLVPGDRPQGVLTTGQLQNLVHLHRAPIGDRAVVVGAELVSWSAVLTLRHAHCAVALMVTEHPSPECYAAVNLIGGAALRTPIATRSRVAAVLGKGRVRAVEVEDLDSGARRVVPCDTVVFTGDWIPDHELARLGGIDLDPNTKGPAVDAALRTERPGVFAVGNLVHPVDTADVAALDGHHVAPHVLAYLRGERSDEPAIRVRAQHPLRWVAPNRLRRGSPAPARNRLLLWSDELVRWPRVVVRQDGREIGARRLPWPAAPGRVFRVPASILADVDWEGGDVEIVVQPTRGP